MSSTEIIREAVENSRRSRTTSAQDAATYSVLGIIEAIAADVSHIRTPEQQVAEIREALAAYRAALARTM